MVPWYFYAFLTAIGSGFVFIVQKRILKDEHSLEFSTESSVAVFLLSLIFIPLADWSALTLRNLFWVYLISIFGATGFLLICKGLRHSNISKIVPFSNFGPMLVALVAFIFLGESLTLMQLAGMLLIITGAYALEADHNMKDLLRPFRKILSSRYTLIFLFGFLFYAFAGTIERFVLLKSIDPFTAIIILHFFLSINYLAYETVRGEGVMTFVNHFRKHRGMFVVLSGLSLFHRTMGYLAIQSAPAVALVSAIKRTGSFIATLVGGKLFHEDGVLQKTIACVILIAGAVLVVVF